MVKKEWFESWFDTPYYHLLYKDRDQDEAKRFIKNLVDTLKIAPGSRVLDLACGKGRHSVTLNELGFDVMGVDLSQNSIYEANKLGNATLQFLVHDMRFPILEQKFDVVFNLFTSFGYFDNTQENEEVIHAVHTMLKEGGLFIIDFMNSAKVIKGLVESESKIIGNIRFEISRSFDGTHIFKTIRFSDAGKEHEYTERVQALNLSDFKTMLEAQGFTILRTFGNINLDVFDEENSERLILIAEKHS